MCGETSRSLACLQAVVNAVRMLRNSRPFRLRKTLPPLLISLYGAGVPSQHTVQWYHPALSVLSMLRLHRQLSSLKVDVRPFESQGFGFNPTPALMPNKIIVRRGSAAASISFLSSSKLRKRSRVKGSFLSLPVCCRFSCLTGFCPSEFVPLDAAVEEIAKARKLAVGGNSSAFRNSCLLVFL